jgi:phage portal protein BeeE
MGIFTNWFKKKEPEQETRGLFCDSLMYNMNGSYTTNKAMLLSTVYRCVDVISDAVAQLPLEPYYITDSGYKEKFIKHPTYLHCIYNHRTTKTNQKYPSVNL